MNEEPLDDQIAELEEHNRKLAAHHKNLEDETAATNRRVAYYEHLHNEKIRMEREIARMEGREYRDPDKPDGDWPEATEDPPEP